MSCPVCQSNNVESIGVLDKVCPVQNFIFSTSEAALAVPKAQIHLQRCSECSFVYNANFEANLVDYSGMDYNNSQANSKVFQDYLDSVEARLRKYYSLTGKKIVEVGCGDGSFVKRFAKDNDCYGFDPALYGNIEAKNLELHKDFYNGQLEGIDLMISRHTFEHVPSPRTFVNEILNNRPKNIYIEIPRLEYILETGEHYALTYEHCSWYSQECLEKLLSKHGYYVTEFRREFEDEFLGLYASLDGSKGLVEESYSLVQFQEWMKEIQTYYSNLDEDLKKWSEQGKEVLLWGVAGKGITVMTSINNYKNLSYAVDANPAKDLKYVPITNIPIYHPDTLKKKLAQGAIKVPDLVLITNNRYEIEIANTLKEIFKKEITIKHI